jgi:predicted small lipoprotein YifL
MQPEPHRLAPRALLAAMAMLTTLAGCGSFGAREELPPPRAGLPAADRDTQVAVLLAGTLQSLQRLAGGTPAEQAEIVATARQSWERAPGGSAQLRYALVLATPGHGARDPERARQLLRSLAAQPEVLAPVERALAHTELAQLDRELGLQGDNQRLQSELARVEQEQTGAGRKLAAETDENARLRKLLEDAQAKLAAIAALERNLSERKPAPADKSTTEARKK